MSRRESMSHKFRKKFPNLAREIEQRKAAIRIDAVRTDAGEAEKAATPYVQGYEPTVIDYLRRCDTDEQALEIIDFLENRGELEPEYAERLRNQLARYGLRSFGSKKDPGYYELGR
jgi:hypothetical protein